MNDLKSFASDNVTGVHPRIMQAIAEANQGPAKPYGQDPWTARADELLRREFGQDIDPYFVFLGTAANVLSLAAMLRPYKAVLCADSAHINVDECGAPERFSGARLLTVPSRNGKVAPEDFRRYLYDLGVEHHSQPAVISITQCTEYGTLYSPDEITALADFAHEHGLYLHMDGARLANACAALNLTPRQLTADCGVDTLSFGGTKNGLMFGEAVILFRKELGEDFRYQRKQAMQLYSKMRFIAAQFSALLEDGLWLENARHANAMTALLAERAAAVPGVRLTRPVQTNHVFATLPRKAAEKLQQDWHFYTWREDPFEVRWMTSFDTEEKDVIAFTDALAEACKDCQA
ncbi:aromatic amino acid beta-eliminating lyase/threonine aldolase [Desulfovibrio sp. X2]|uniref:threonine aldolase family protein n=1 Tax=Desulfovibrio sp. X2 TaxID=941449 RepID=UPI000358A4BB|nr:low specificity L-threonine aldolase [Desulfovibrio sp. X2]EPR39823.1 aromatic amino acid beta-eliminating lyase/threonine aldolase [Desulfovibrio sp. X2]